MSGKMGSKDDAVYMKHMLDSIDAIMDFSKGMDAEELASNRMKRSAIVREIEIIGESVKNVSDATSRRYGNIKWKEIAGTRDKMIHHYFGVDLDIILAIVREDLPGLKKDIGRILEEMEG